MKTAVQSGLKDERALVLLGTRPGFTEVSFELNLEKRLCHVNMQRRLLLAKGNNHAQARGTVHTQIWAKEEGGCHQCVDNAMTGRWV